MQKLALCLVLVVSATVFAQNPGFQDMSSAVSPRVSPEMDATIQRPLPSILPSAPIPRPLILARLEKPVSAGIRRGTMRVGEKRALPAYAFNRGLATTASDGRALWTLSIQSPGAAGIRVHFRDFDVGNGEVWLYSPAGDQPAGPYTGKGIFGTGDFWSASVFTETVIVAFVRMGNTPTSATPPFSIDAIAHLWGAFDNTSPVVASSPPVSNGRDSLSLSNAAIGQAYAAASCELDVTCYPSYQQASTAIVQYNFIADDGGSYVCSGSMINTRSNSFKPYMLTANHCIGSSFEAQSIEARFFLSNVHLQGAASKHFYRTQSRRGDVPEQRFIPAR